MPLRQNEEDDGKAGGARAPLAVLEDEPAIEVKTFQSFPEISSLPEFKSGNPVDKGNYRDLIGDYLFEDEVKCCFRKDNGNLCDHAHKFGFVVKLTDGSVTVVGNCCAKDKFGAHAKIRTDRRKYLNEKHRIAKLTAVRALLLEKDFRLRTIKDMREQLRQTQAKVDVIKGNLGDVTARKLLDMTRTNNNSVSVKCITLKQYVEDGMTKTERRVSETTLGVLKGVRVFSEANFRIAYSAMTSAERALLDIEAVSDKASIKQLDDLTARLELFRTSIMQSESLVNAYREFLDNDFLLLCFLVNDKVERYRAARLAMQYRNISGGKEAAKAWLADQEQRIRRALGVDRLEIAG